LIVGQELVLAISQLHCDQVHLVGLKFLPSLDLEVDGWSGRRTFEDQGVNDLLEGFTSETRAALEVTVELVEDGEELVGVGELGH
jgi:hypothetical protein